MALLKGLSGNLGIWICSLGPHMERGPPLDDAWFRTLNMHLINMCRVSATIFKNPYFCYKNSQDDVLPQIRDGKLLDF